MVPEILPLQGVGNDPGIDKKIIIPHMVKVAVGVYKHINVFRPGLLGDLSRTAVDHNTYIIINEHGVGFAESFLGEKY